jgi:hypothetical protein
MAHPSLSAYGSFLAHSARAGYNSGTPASGRGRSVADRRVTVSEGRKRAFPGYALWAASRTLPNVLTYAGPRDMNGGREIRRFVAGD